MPSSLGGCQPAGASFEVAWRRSRSNQRKDGEERGRIEGSAYHVPRSATPLLPHATSPLCRPLGCRAGPRAERVRPAGGRIKEQSGPCGPAVAEEARSPHPQEAAQHWPIRPRERRAAAPGSRPVPGRRGPRRASWPRPRTPLRTPRRPLARPHRLHPLARRKTHGVLLLRRCRIRGSITLRFP